MLTGVSEFLTQETLGGMLSVIRNRVNHTDHKTTPRLYSADQSHADGVDIMDPYSSTNYTVVPLAQSHFDTVTKYERPDP